MEDKTNQKQQQQHREASGDNFRRAPSNENQEIFMLPRQKSRSRDRRESRLFLVDGQLCWTEEQATGSGLAAAGSGKRHSSVGLMFGSSMDLSGIGQSIDSSGAGGSGSEEAVSYRIKWCRENILQLKRQTWPMEKKLQVLKASKLFIKQHQGELKQSKQAKDVLASGGAIFDRYWRHFKREFANFLVIITPWEMRIKKIESHFGSVVASYFTFLRWIFWLNLANSLVMVAFVMVPELIENNIDLTGMRKGELGMQQPIGLDGKPQKPPDFNPTLGEMWEFEGFLKFSPIFYGYYSNVEISRSGFWRNPLAFLMSAMLTYLFCFFCISRKLSQNTKLSRIGSKDDEYTFCWTVFVGWDFMIGNSETAYNKTSSLVMNLKEGILEEKEQTKDRDWRLIIRRVFANVLTLMLIIASAYVVTLAVQRSENLPEDASIIQKNELQFVMTGIQFMFPPLFDLIGLIEMYHPRKALSWQLGRILFLDFLNFYTLMLALFGTVDQMGKQLNEVSGNITLFRQNATYYRNLFTTTTTTTTIAPPPPETTTTGNLFPVVVTNISNLATSSNSSSILLASSLDSQVTSASGGLINSSAGAVLTSVVLLANSSTILPLNNESTTSLVTTTVDTTTTTQIVFTNQTMFEGNVTTFSPSPISISESPPTTTTTSTSTTTKSVKEDEEDDYPDVAETIKEIGRRKRAALNLASNGHRKRKRKKKMNFVGEEEGEVVTFSSSQLESSAEGHSSKTTTKKPKFSRVFFGALIPTIQDPYRKLGTSTASSPPANFQFGAETDEEQEEPLEGRLFVSGRKTTTTTSTTRRPSTRKTPIARPIGGVVARVQPKRGRVQQPPTSFDDDQNEDVLEASSELAIDFQEYTTTGSGFVEPTTETSISNSPTKPVLEEGQPSSSNPNYSIDGVEPAASTPSTSGNSSDSPGPAVVGKSALQPTSESSLPESSSSEVATETSVSSCTAYSSFDSTSGSSNPTNNSLSSSANKNKQVGFNASEVDYSDCIEIPQFKHQEILALNQTFKDKLKSLCWETMFGQEMVKIVVMDLVMTVISAVSFEFMRACFVRYCNRFFFWDLERGFPGYQDFKIAENVLHLVNNQTTVWMGMFFAPGLPAINTVKLAVLMYVRSWAVLTCNIPHETVFKVSKSNNFYYWILLINLLICILPVAYAVTWIRPSWHCGPFGGECRMYIVVTKLVKSMLPPEANSIFKYLTSPGAVIPTLIALILIIYYLASTVSSSKEANKELKAQLKKDKEQEAAVPEITSTAVLDTSPSSAPAPAPAVQQAATLASSGQPPTGSGGLAAPVGGGGGVTSSASLAPPSMAGGEPKARPAKSLLMPPAIS